MHDLDIHQWVVPITASPSDDTEKDMGNAQNDLVGNYDYNNDALIESNDNRFIVTPLNSICKPHRILI